MKKSHYISQSQSMELIFNTLKELRTKNYTLQFRREISCLYCLELHQWIMPENFTVDESYYFEEMINPDADRMLYAISLSQGGKGFLIDTSTVYMDNISREMAERLNVISTYEDFTNSN